MNAGILDTTVVIHVYRKYQAALTWFASQQTTFSITPVTWMEVMVGVTSKRSQMDTLKLLSGFELIYLPQRTWIGRCSRCSVIGSAKA